MRAQKKYMQQAEPAALAVASCSSKGFPRRALPSVGLSSSPDPAFQLSRIHQICHAIGSTAPFLSRCVTASCANSLAASSIPSYNVCVHDTVFSKPLSIPDVEGKTHLPAFLFSPSALMDPLQQQQDLVHGRTSHHPTAWPPFTSSHRWYHFLTPALFGYCISASNSSLIGSHVSCPWQTACDHTLTSALGSSVHRPSGGTCARKKTIVPRCLSSAEHTSAHATDLTPYRSVGSPAICFRLHLIASMVHVIQDVRPKKLSTTRSHVQCPLVSCPVAPDE